MLCDKCKKNQATFHITQIINHEKHEEHLCEVCSQEISPFAGSHPANFSFNKFLAHLLTYDPDLTGKNASGTGERCENCGLSYEQFAKGGRLGCSNCYAVFQKHLSPLLSRIHRAETHKGKVPERTGAQIRIIKELESLKQEMSLLVSREEFERAAQIRDQIKELEKTMAGKEMIKNGTSRYFNKTGEQMDRGPRPGK